MIHKFNRKWLIKMVLLICTMKIENTDSYDKTDENFNQSQSLKNAKAFFLFEGNLTIKLTPYLCPSRGTRYRNSANRIWPRHDSQKPWRISDKFSNPSGSLYIDIQDYESAGKVQSTLHSFWKYDLMPEHCSTKKCLSCTASVRAQDLELLSEITIQVTQDLIYPDHTSKVKVI